MGAFMGTASSQLQQRIESGKPIVLAEISPPGTANPEAVRALVRQAAGKVHALGISDNRHRIGMSALAAAALAVAEGVEPILHVITRDRNRIALVSQCLGAQALGVPNLLCTSGTHQTLGQFRAARNVFDLDAVQLLETCSHLATDAKVVGEPSLNGGGPLCLGAVASPMAEPAEMQMLKLQKKVRAGARFVITQPVFDVARFTAWWNEATRIGLTKQVAVIAGIQPLADLASARALAAGRPRTIVPDALLDRLAAKSDAAAQRAEGIAIAVETIAKLSPLAGLRGFAVSAETDLAAGLEVLAKAGLSVN